MRVVVLALMVTIGCGTSPTPSDASVEAGFEFINCASTEPPVGAPCDVPGYACEYGSDVNATCNEVRVCESYGGETKWVRRQPAPPDLCPTPAVTSPECASSFPSGSCSSTADGGATCDYAPQGFCVCDVHDSGANWRCDDQSGCPHPRPRLGSACTSEGQTCDYLSCFVAWAATVTCSGGVWLPVTLCD